MFVCLLLLAGCGSSGSKSNGVAAKTADQIVADAQASAAGATSVHVSGAQGSALVINLSLVAGKGGKGRITANGLTFDMVRIGPTAYFKGDSAFWRQFGGQAMAQLMGDRWLKAPVHPVNSARSRRSPTSPGSSTASWAPMARSRRAPSRRETARR
jgi:hypothetical protein